MAGSGNDGRTTRRQFIGAAGGVGAAALTGMAFEALGASPALAAASPKKGGTLYEARYEAIDGFKLDSITANTTYQSVQAVMEPLVRSNSAGNGYMPGLAQSWSHNPAATAWTFRLYPNVRFSNGKLCTSKDVAFSVDTWRSGSNNGFYYKNIKNVQIHDARTFTLHLGRPDFTMLSPLSMAIAGVIPENFAGMSAQQFWLTPIGAGPYVLGKWSVSGPINYSRNPHYFRKGLPYLDKIVNTLTTNGNSSRLAFMSGQLDVVDGVFGTEAGGYPSGSIKWEPVHFTDVLLFNNKSKPFSNIDARRAVAYAIDYGGLAKAVYKGYGQTPNGFLSPNVGVYSPPSKPYFSHQPKVARELARKAGLTGQTLTLVYPPEEQNFAEDAALVAANLKSIGVNVKLRPEATPTFLGSVTTNHYDMAVWGYNASAPDMGNIMAFVGQTDFFFSGYPSTQLDAVLTKFQEASTQAQQRKFVQQAQNIGLNGAGFVALAYSRYGTAIRSNVHGVDPTPWGYYYYDNIWKG